MKKHFVTSDLHLGHAKSIEFDKRPFKDVEHMHYKIIENFNKVVPTDGITFILGDVGFRDKNATRDVITSLNGTLILILGNHDDGVEAALKLGFHAAIYGAVIYIQGHRVTMSHCPLKGVYREPTDHFHNESRRGWNWHGEDKNHRFTFADEGQFHLHGHIHSSKHTEHLEVGKRMVHLGRQLDIGLPAHNYRPVPMGYVESWIMKTVRAEESNNQKVGSPSDQTE